MQTMQDIGQKKQEREAYRHACDRSINTGALEEHVVISDIIEGARNRRGQSKIRQGALFTVRFGFGQKFQDDEEKFI